MTLPAADDIKTLIAAPCLVRPDRAGRSLFISDFARRLGAQALQAAERLEAAGYALTPLHGGMTLIDWPRPAYLAWYRLQPPPKPPTGHDRAAALQGMLMRHPAPVEAQDGEVLLQALRFALLGQEAKLCDLLEGAFARALRERRAAPYHGVHALGVLKHNRR